MLQTEMTDSPTLSYTSTSEISTPSYTWSLKKGTPLGWSLPYKAIMRSNPPPSPPFPKDTDISWETVDD